MNGDFNQENSTPKTFGQRLPLFAGIVVVILLGAVGGYLAFSPAPSAPPKIDIKQIPADVVSNLPGKLYLSLAPVGSWHVDLYTLTAADASLEKNTRDGLVSYTESVSHDGNMAAFFADAFDANKARRGFIPIRESFQLYTQDLTTGEITQRTDEIYDAARSPQWSPDDNYIAFTSRISPDPDRAWESENWTVHVYNMQTDTVVDVGVGTHPLWTPDGKHIVVLGNDGLYAYNPMSNSPSQKIITSKPPRTNAMMKLGLSNNSTPLLLAWTSRRTLRLWEIEQDKDGNFTGFTLFNDFSTGDKQFFWPTFSPNDKFVAVQEADIDAGGELYNPKIVIFNVQTGERFELLSLENFNFDIAFISDWK